MVGVYARDTLTLPHITHLTAKPSRMIGVQVGVWCARAPYTYLYLNKEFKSKSKWWWSVSVRARTYTHTYTHKHERLRVINLMLT